MQRVSSNVNVAQGLLCSLIYLCASPFNVIWVSCLFLVCSNWSGLLRCPKKKKLLSDYWDVSPSILQVVMIMSVRLWLMGGSMPLFSEQDNPASFSPHLLTRSALYSHTLFICQGYICQWKMPSLSMVFTYFWTLAIMHTDHNYAAACLYQCMV